MSISEKNPIKRPKIRVEYLTCSCWETLEEMVFDGVTIEKGFITDFASIPKIMRFWINPMDCPLAAISHDKKLTILAVLETVKRVERFKAWVLINRSMRLALKIQGRHISKAKKAAIIFAINANAVYKCFIVNKQPCRAKRLSDFKGLERA
jgi:hypothetical protein